MTPQRNIGFSLTIPRAIARAPSRMQLRNLRAGRSDGMPVARNRPNTLRTTRHPISTGDPEDASCRPTRGQHSPETSVTPTLDDLSCERTQIECSKRSKPRSLSAPARNGPTDQSHSHKSCWQNRTDWYQARVADWIAVS